ncbi:hypothetical protein [Campylobacter sp. RM16190]|uniref:hypothetical protein n=1 Tax=Campylobacter sp. RM16190 TaxID=1705727 RepID=UPI0014732CCE|nr:hypothetical protein [Campylobacter sp. RM16190]
MFNRKTYARGELVELENDLTECEAKARVLGEALNNKILFSMFNINFTETRVLIRDLEQNQDKLNKLKAEIQRIKAEFDL